MFGLGHDLTLESFQLSLLEVFMKELTFLSQMSAFPRKFNHHWKFKEQKEDFQTILVFKYGTLQCFGSAL